MPFFFTYYLGSILGRIDFFISNKKCIGKMNTNLCRALEINKMDARNIIKDNLCNHMRNMLELIKYPQTTKENIHKLVYYDGINHLSEALEKGCGVILLTAHYGAKQLLQVALGLEGYSVNQINYHLGDDELTFTQKRISQHQRRNIEEKLPLRFISANGYMRAAFEALGRNQLLIIAGDGIGLKRYMNKSYKRFSFLGQKMFFPTNTIKLAHRTRASIIPVFVVREKRKHRIAFEPPLDWNAKNNYAMVYQYVNILEKYVCLHPSFWDFWEEFDEENLTTGI